jgi:hypothetical protein
VKLWKGFGPLKTHAGSLGKFLKVKTKAGGTFCILEALFERRHNGKLFEREP